MLDLSRLRRSPRFVPEKGKIDKFGRRIAPRRGRKLALAPRIGRKISIEEAHALMRELYPGGTSVEELAERIGYRATTIRKLASQLGLTRKRWVTGHVPG